MQLYIHNCLSVVKKYALSNSVIQKWDLSLNKEIEEALPPTQIAMYVLIMFENKIDRLEQLA